MRKEYYVLFIALVIMIFLSGFFIYSNIQNHENDDNDFELLNTTLSNGWSGVTYLFNQTNSSPESFMESILPENIMQKVLKYDNESINVSAAGGTPFILFEFELTNISNEIQMTFLGHSSQRSGGGIYLIEPSEIFIYDYFMNHWQSISVNWTGSSEKFVNQTKIYVLVLGPLSHGYSDGSILYCDKIELIANYPYKEE